MKIIQLKETDSTNRWLQENGGEEDVAVVTDYQSAGCGQKGNVWESEAGKNLLFSILIHPQNVPAHRQFVLSELIALAVSDVLGKYTEGICVKWPNDIYWHDRKICGILIENRLQGKGIRDSILGVGVNVNQDVFRSDAPNPVSLKMITGREYDLRVLMDEIMASFSRYYCLVEQGEYEHLHEEYLQSLYRREGFYPYRDASGPFEAKISRIEEDGHLVLTDTDGRSRRYAFKEVECEKVKK